jgi:hypothetical protein
MKTHIPARVLALVIGTTALAIAVLARTWIGPPTLAHDFWFWFVACVIGEMLWVRLPVGNATASMASCLHFATLLVLPVGHAMAVVTLSGLVSELAFIRKPPIRAVFNASQSGLAVAAASAVIGWFASFLTVHDADPILPGAAHPVALLAAATLYFVINKGAVTAAVALNDRVPPRKVWRANFGGGYELVANGALMSLGVLLASYYALQGARGTLLVALPLLVAYEGYRWYARRKVTEDTDSRLDQAA